MLLFRYIFRLDLHINCKIYGSNQIVALIAIVILMGEPIFMKLDTYIMPAEPIWTAHFIYPISNTNITEPHISET